MTTSAVEICNMALSAVPARHIVSLNENTKPAKECRIHYPQVIADLLETGGWTWATKRVRLTEIANKRRDWRRAFQAPPDMGYPLRMMVSEFETGLSSKGSILFDWEGGVFWAGEAEVWLEYVSDQPEYRNMTAKFRTALIETLAAKLVMPISGNQQREQVLTSRAEVYRDRAVAADLNHNEPQNTYGTDYLPEVLRGMMSDAD